jgi:hypothetical protein
MALAAAFYVAMKGKGTAAMLWLAWGTYLSFYPWMLVLPVILLVRKSHMIVSRKPGTWALYVPYLYVYAVGIALLAVVTYCLLIREDLEPLKLALKSTDPERLWFLMHSDWASVGYARFLSYLHGVYGIMYVWLLNQLII